MHTHTKMHTHDQKGICMFKQQAFFLDPTGDSLPVTSMRLFQIMRAEVMMRPARARANFLGLTAVQWYFCSY